MTDVYIYQIDMPCGFHEAVSPGWEDDCTVYVNSKDSMERRIRSVDHAIEHLRRDDFSGESVQQVEADAHERRMK